MPNPIFAAAIALLGSAAMTCDASSGVATKLTAPHLEGHPIENSEVSAAHAYKENYRIVIPDAKTIAVFDEGLASANWMVRLSATTAFACVPSDFALPRLEKRLADVEPDVRAAAVIGLSHHLGGRASALLKSVQDDTSEDLSIRVLAASALTHPANTCE